MGKGGREGSSMCAAYSSASPVSSHMHGPQERPPVRHALRPSTTPWDRKLMPAVWACPHNRATGLCMFCLALSCAPPHSLPHCRAPD